MKDYYDESWLTDDEMVAVCEAIFESYNYKTDTENEERDTK